MIDIRDGAGYKPYLEEPSEMDFEIGNYFSSKEEAELVVRKLKAWKRLKDKGLKFKGIIGYDETHFWFPNPNNIEFMFENRETRKDLNLLLFGGEE